MKGPVGIHRGAMDTIDTNAAAVTCQVFGLATHAMAICRHDGSVLEANPAALRLFGWTSAAGNRLVPPATGCAPIESAVGERVIRLESVPFEHPAGPAVLVSALDVTAERALFDSNPCPMWIEDPLSLSVVAVNDAALRLYGYSRKQFLDLATSRLEVTPADHRNRAVHRTLSGQPVEVELSPRRLDFEGRSRVLVAARDVTEDSNNRRDGMRREAWYRCLIEHTTGIITVLEQSGVLRYVSPSLPRTLDRTAADMIGKNICDLVHPDDRVACQSALRQVLRDNGQTASVEFRLRNSAGDWLVFEAYGHNLLDEPAITGIVVYGHNISRRRKTQQELSDTNERLRLAQRAGQVGTWECCCATGKLRFSEEAARLHGVVPPFEPADVLARLHPDDEVRVKTALGLSRISGSLNLEDYRVVWPNGTVHWLHSRGEVPQNRGTGASRLLAVVTDVTARKQAEQDAAAARDQALEASRLKSQFLATVSHEIRTPMNGIIGMTGLLLDSDLTSQQRTDAEIIRTSALYLLDLINDLLDFSRIEAGKIVLNDSTFDLYDCLNTVVDLMLPQATARGLRLELAYPDSLCRTWTGPVGRIRQIVLNFTANAVKFTDRGFVRIAASAVGDSSTPRLRLSVTDSGPGIDITAQLRLFSKFVQLDGTSTRKHGGTGLGLAISKSLAEAMGGTVGVNSKPGDGSEFWVELPLQPASSLSPDHQARSQSDWPAPVRPGRILVAEDNLVNQKLAVRLLEKRGHRVDVASDGHEAVQMWSRFPYDVILMDCQMPEVDGLEATRQIRQAEAGSGRRVPVIALTAHAALEDGNRCLEAGMDRVLTKPFQPSELDEALADWLPRVTTRVELRPLRSGLQQLPEASLRLETRVP